ncbi:MAG: alpha/beta fold hydrolase [Candidatus Nanoarchaeia archaeon]|nr:alpha/beta fold hydrolase [Candidatus Nanoarchaeia archaeon]MDD5238923.1 alpha/beta fold hydrolase [Candidatus Nanoarchaeia archaeon]
MREEKHKFKSGELELAGTLTHPEIETKDCIVLCHGITVDKDEGGMFTELAHKLAEVGLAVFRFDFRGHGESQGNSIDLTITGEKTDVESAVKFLQKLGYERFGICAASFGGGSSLLYTAEHQDIIKALCLWNAVIDYHGFLNPELPWPKENFGPEQMNHLNEKGYLEVGERKFRLGKAIFKEMLEIEPHKVLKDIRIPVLFIHGNKDTYVPYEDSVLYSKIPPVSKLITIEGADHGFHEKKEWAEESDSATVNFFRRAFF